MLADPRLYRETCMKYFSPELVALSDNLMLNEYLYYYYYREQAIAAIVEGGETRGEQIAAINRQMLSALGELDIPRQLEHAFSVYFSHYLQRENSYMQRESSRGKVKTREMLTLQQFIEQPDSGGYAGWRSIFWRRSTAAGKNAWWYRCKTATRSIFCTRKT